MEKFLIKFIEFFNLERQVISRDDGSKYLTRFYVFRKTRWWMPSIYIHCFHSGDHDYCLHSHPWLISASLILSGQYLEERRDKKDRIYSRVLSPGNINIIAANDFHRVDLLSDKVWTLFVSGAKVQTWGFWNRDTGKFVNHADFTGDDSTK